MECCERIAKGHYLWLDDFFAVTVIITRIIMVTSENWPLL
jgi:hypothetical protein